MQHEVRVRLEHPLQAVELRSRQFPGNPSEQMTGRKFCGRVHAFKARFRISFVEESRLPGLIDQNAGVMHGAVAGTKFDSAHEARLADWRRNQEVAINIL